MIYKFCKIAIDGQTKRSNEDFSNFMVNLKKINNSINFPINISGVQKRTELSGRPNI